MNIRLNINISYINIYLVILNLIKNYLHICMIKLKKILPYILIITAGAIAYINTVANGFVYDDASVIQKNRYIENFSNITDVFSTKEYFARSGVGKYKRYGEGSYRPVVTISYFIDCLLFEKQAFGYHLINLIYHLILCILIYNLLFSISKNKLFALISAIIFAVHPLGTEPINAISFREDILCGIFLIIGLQYYIKYLDIKPKSIKYLTISNIMFMLACLSKENGVIMLPIIFAYNHMVYRELNIRNLIRQVKSFLPVYLSYAATMILFFILRFKIFALKEPSIESVNFEVMTDRLVRFINLIAYYLRLIIAPDKLSPAYNENFLVKPIFLSISIPVTLLIVFLIHFLRKKKYYSFFLSWYLISLIPVSGLVYLFQPVAERYLYIPMIGIICCFALFLTSINIKKSIFIIIALIVMMTNKSISQNTIWKSEFSLWQYCVKRAPNNYNALANFAVVLSDSGRHQDSIGYFKKALKLDNRAQSHYNLSNSYLRLGMREKSIEELRTCISLDPNFSEAHNNLGKLLAEAGKNEEAAKEIKIAISLNPYNAQAYNNLGATYNQMRQYENAINALTRAIEIYPNYASAYFNLSSSFLQINEFNKAEYCIRKVISYEPNNTYAKKYLRTIISQKKASEMTSPPPPPAKKKPKQPVSIKKSSDLKLSTKNNIPRPQGSLANVYNVEKLHKEAAQLMATGKYVQAIPLYRKAMQTEPNNPQTYIKLADCYTKLGSFKLALKEITNALEIAPDLKEGLEKKSELERILGIK